MTKEKILKELEQYLPPVRISELRLAVVGRHSGVQLSLTITDIVRAFNSSQSTEDKVCDLLQEYMRLSIKKPKMLK